MMERIETRPAAEGQEAAASPHVSPSGSAPRGSGPDDWIIDQDWASFTPEEHGVWNTLFLRQKEMLQSRVVRTFSEGLGLLSLCQSSIPDFAKLNAILGPRTGWTVVAVPGLVPDEIFFQLLSERRFPAGNFIRKASQLDYLEEPDVFHDVFGHVPLLADPAFADFMQKLGMLGVEAGKKGAIHRLSRLYWYIVEFGLAREDGDLRIFGAGIASSFAESRYSLESDVPQRLEFDLKRVLRTSYRNDAIQRGYFVIESFEAILKDLREVDLVAMLTGLEGEPDLDPHTIYPGDRPA